MADLGNQLEDVGDGLDRFLEALDNSSIRLGSNAAIEAAAARNQEKLAKEKKSHDKKLKKLEKEQLKEMRAALPFHKKQVQYLKDLVKTSALFNKSLKENMKDLKKWGQSLSKGPVGKGFKMLAGAAGAGIVGALVVGIKAIIDGMLKIDSMMGSLVKSTGSFRSTLVDVRKIVLSVSYDMSTLGITMENAAAEAGNLIQHFGRASFVTKDLVKLSLQMQKAFGMTAESSGQLIESLTRINKDAREFVETLRSDAVMAGTSVSLVMRNVASQTQNIAIQTSRSVEDIKQMAIEAARAGVGIESMTKMGDAFVDPQQIGDNIGAVAQKLGGDIYKLNPYTLWNLSDTRQIKKLNDLVLGAFEKRIELNEEGNLVNLQTGEILRKSTLKAMAQMAGMTEEQLARVLIMNEEYSGMAGHMKEFADNSKQVEKIFGKEAGKDLKNVFFSIQDAAAQITDKEGNRKYTQQQVKNMIIGEKIEKDVVDRLKLRIKEAREQEAMNRLIKEQQNLLERIKIIAVGIFSDITTSFSEIFGLDARDEESISATIERIADKIKKTLNMEGFAEDVKTGGWMKAIEDRLEPLGEFMGNLLIKAMDRMIAHLRKNSTFFQGILGETAGEKKATLEEQMKMRPEERLGYSENESKTQTASREQDALKVMASASQTIAQDISETQGLKFDEESEKIWQQSVGKAKEAGKGADEALKLFGETIAANARQVEINKIIEEGKAKSLEIQANIARAGVEMDAEQLKKEEKIWEDTVKVAHRYGQGLETALVMYERALIRQEELEAVSIKKWRKEKFGKDYEEEEKATEVPRETKNVEKGFTAYAKGGIVTKPTRALIGEAGPELVLPLDGGITSVVPLSGMQKFQTGAHFIPLGGGGTNEDEFFRKLDKRIEGMTSGQRGGLIGSGSERAKRERAMAAEAETKRHQRDALNWWRDHYRRELDAAGGNARRIGELERGDNKKAWYDHISGFFNKYPALVDETMQKALGKHVQEGWGSELYKGVFSGLQAWSAGGSQEEALRMGVMAGMGAALKEGGTLNVFMQGLQDTNQSLLGAIRRSPEERKKHLQEQTQKLSDMEAAHAAEQQKLLAEELREINTLKNQADTALDNEMKRLDLAEKNNTLSEVQIDTQREIAKIQRESAHKEWEEAQKRTKAHYDKQIEIGNEQIETQKKQLETLEKVNKQVAEGATEAKLHYGVMQGLTSAMNAGIATFMAGGGMKDVKQAALRYGVSEGVKGLAESFLGADAMKRAQEYHSMGAMMPTGGASSFQTPSFTEFGGQVLAGMDEASRRRGYGAGDPGGKGGTYNPLGLPEFAEGGIVTQPTNALIGEAGAEAVIPLSGRGELLPDHLAALSSIDSTTKQHVGLTIEHHGMLMEQLGVFFEGIVDGLTTISGVNREIYTVGNEQRWAPLLQMEEQLLGMENQQIKLLDGIKQGLAQAAQAASSGGGGGVDVGGIMKIASMFGGGAATGKKVSSPTLMMVGEEGRSEVVVPTERIRKGLPINKNVAKELGSIGVPGFDEGDVLDEGDLLSPMMEFKPHKWDDDEMQSAFAATSGYDDLHSGGFQEISDDTFSMQKRDALKTGGTLPGPTVWDKYAGGVSGRMDKMGGLKGIGKGSLAAGALSFADTYMQTGDFGRAATGALGSGAGMGIGMGLTALGVPPPLSTMAGKFAGQLITKGLNKLTNQVGGYKKGRNKAFKIVEQHIKSQGLFDVDRPKGLPKAMEQAIGGYEKQPQEAKYKGLIKKLNTSKHLARSGVSPEALIALKQGQVSGAEALEIYKNMNIALYGHEGGTKYMRLAAMPQLAEGGIVTKPTAAVIGEKGPEMVIPLHEQRKSNKEMVDELKKQNKLMTDMIKAQKETQAPEIRLDGRKISESVGENFYETGLGI